LKTPGIYLTFLFTVAAAVTCANAQGRTIDVASFGAVPDDGKNDLEPVRKALAACAGQKGATLKLHKGTYELAWDRARRKPDRRGAFPPFFQVKDAAGLTIEGNGAKLVGRDFAGFFRFSGCSKLVVRGLVLDLDPQPITCARIVAVSKSHIDVKPVAPYVARDGWNVEGVFGFDPEKGRPSTEVIDCYLKDNSGRSQVLENGIMRVPFRGRAKVGAAVVVRHYIYCYNGFSLDHCSDILFEDVTIYSAAGMGIHASDSTDMTVRKLQVRAGEDGKRWMTTTADATHFNTCRGTFVMEDCFFERMGDDAANIHSFFLIVSGLEGKDTIRATLKRVYSHSMPWHTPRIGDEIKFGGGKNPLVPYASRKIKSVRADRPKKDLIITFTEPLPEKAAVDNVVWNATAAPSIRITRCTVRNNRARGMLIQTRGVILEDCLFQDCSGAALHVASDLNYWHEGIGVRDLVIRKNRFVGCNYGAAKRRSVIDIFSDVKRAPAPAGVHRGITIEQNRFESSNNSPIHVGSAEGVVIRDNVMVNPTGPAVLVDHSRDVQITGNTLEGGRGGVKVGPGCDEKTIEVQDNRGL
jgi:nitrous oxidase accessory protein NosD